MILKNLKLVQVRAIEEAKFDFEQGMNLLVGVNGVGKSTVLDALRIMLINILTRITEDGSRAENFGDGDVRKGQEFLSVELTCELAETPFAFLIHKPLEPFIEDPDRKGEVRHQTIATKEKREFVPAGLGTRIDTPALKSLVEHSRTAPLAVYFGTERSVVSGEGSKRRGSHADALSPRRQFQLSEYANWWRTREALSDENPAYRAQIGALRDAISGFLDGCHVVGATNSENPTLTLSKNGIEVDAAQLSDGERGVLALVLDLTRRLAQANPKLDDPAREGQAVVLIDEIDLHLHPGWQRLIAHRLTSVFPRCQFICTTHSPQLISEVESGAIQYLIWEDGKVAVKQHPQSYGLDTNWILEFLMDVPSQPAHIAQLLDEVDDAIDRGEFSTARTKLEHLKQEMRGDTGEIARREASLNTFEALADENNSEES